MNPIDLFLTAARITLVAAAIAAPVVVIATRPAEDRTAKSVAVNPKPRQF
jgi:hypothetical protein